MYSIVHRKGAVRGPTMWIERHFSVNFVQQITHLACLETGGQDRSYDQDITIVTPRDSKSESLEYSE